MCEKPDFMQRVCTQGSLRDWKSMLWSSRSDGLQIQQPQEEFCDFGHRPCEMPGQTCLILSCYLLSSTDKNISTEKRSSTWDFPI